jgi:hypothetical protein
VASGQRGNLKGGTLAGGAGHALRSPVPVVGQWSWQRGLSWPGVLLMTMRTETTKDLALKGRQVTGMVGA